MRELQIKNNEAGQRLDKYLKKYLNLANSGFIYKMLRKKNILLNNHRAKGNEMLVLEDVVTFYLSDDTLNKFKSEVPLYHMLSDNRIKDMILYEDKNILLLNKPVGILSQKSKIDDVSIVDMVIDYMIAKNELTLEELRTFKPGICNRLDRNTTGIIVAGKSLLGLQEMGTLFKNRSIKKYYLCMVKGIVNKPMRIEGYLTKDEKRNKVLIKDSGESFIETAYKPLAIGDDVTLLKVHLITGKTHQIRAHLASIAHPILGDYKYGDKNSNTKYFKTYQLATQLLHAYELILPENTGALLSLSGKHFLAPLPSKFKKIIEDTKWQHGIPEDLEVQL